MESCIVLLQSALSTYVRTYSGVSRVRVPPEQLFFSKEITLLRLVALAFFEA